MQGSSLKHWLADLKQGITFPWKRGKEKGRGRRGRRRITKRCKRGFGERDMAEEESTATI